MAEINVEIIPKVLWSLCGAQSTEDVCAIFECIADAIKKKDNSGCYGGIVKDYCNAGRLGHLLYVGESMPVVDMQRAILKAIYRSADNALRRIALTSLKSEKNIDCDEWVEKMLIATGSVANNNLYNKVLKGVTPIPKRKSDEGFPFSLGDNVPDHTVSRIVEFLPDIEDKTTKPAKKNAVVSKPEVTAHVPVVPAMRLTYTSVIPTTKSTRTAVKSTSTATASTATASTATASTASTSHEQQSCNTVRPLLFNVATRSDLNKPTPVLRLIRSVQNNPIHNFAPSIEKIESDFFANGYFIDVCGNMCILPIAQNSTRNSETYKKRMSYAVIQSLVGLGIVGIDDVMSWGDVLFDNIILCREEIFFALPYLYKQYFTFNEFMLIDQDKQHETIKELSRIVVLIDSGLFSTSEALNLPNETRQAVAKIVKDFAAMRIRYFLENGWITKQDITHLKYSGHELFDNAKRLTDCFNLGILSPDFPIKNTQDVMRYSIKQWRTIVMCLRDSGELLEIWKLGKISIEFISEWTAVHFSVCKSLLSDKDVLENIKNDKLNLKDEVLRHFKNYLIRRIVKDCSGSLIDIDGNVVTKYHYKSFDYIAKTLIRWITNGTISGSGLRDVENLLVVERNGLKMQLLYKKASDPFLVELVENKIVTFDDVLSWNDDMCKVVYKKCAAYERQMHELLSNPLLSQEFVLHVLPIEKIPVLHSRIQYLNICCELMKNNQKGAIYLCDMTQEECDQFKLLVSAGVSTQDRQTIINMLRKLSSADKRPTARAALRKQTRIGIKRPHSTTEEAHKTSVSDSKKRNTSAVLSMPRFDCDEDLASTSTASNSQSNAPAVLVQAAKKNDNSLFINEVSRKIQKTTTEHIQSKLPKPIPVTANGKIPYSNDCVHTLSVSGNGSLTFSQVPKSSSTTATSRPLNHQASATLTKLPTKPPVLSVTKAPQSKDMTVYALTREGDLVRRKVPKTSLLLTPSKAPNRTGHVSVVTNPSKQAPATSTATTSTAKALQGRGLTISTLSRQSSMTNQQTQPTPSATARSQEQKTSAPKPPQPSSSATARSQEQKTSAPKPQQPPAVDPPSVLQHFTSSDSLYCSPSIDELYSNKKFVTDLSLEAFDDSMDSQQAYLG